MRFDFFEVDICQGLTMIKETFKFPFINQLFRSALETLQKRLIKK